MTGAADLVARGLTALPEALAPVVPVRTETGERELHVRLAGGFAFEVRLDHGLDIGACWWRDRPVAWRSPNRVDPGGADWEARFLGGLLATCGPDNIGPPRGDVGQHGSHHHTPAHEVAWRRGVVGDEYRVEIAGSIAVGALTGPRVLVERTVRATTGTPRLEVTDRVTNVGDAPTGVPLLYHVNIGAPLLTPGSRLRVDAGRTTTREPVPSGRDPLVTPAGGPVAGAVPVVAEHRDLVAPGGRAAARLRAPGGSQPDLVVTWDAATLPRLCTWSWPATGAWVLGIEPTNAPLFGPERESPWAGAPVLEPGASWETGVHVTVEERIGR